MGIAVHFAFKGEVILEVEGDGTTSGVMTSEAKTLVPFLASTVNFLFRIYGLGTFAAYFAFSLQQTLAA